MAHRALIFGCEGPVLSDVERDFFREADPLGFILFARNCESRDQLKKLTSGLRESVGRPDAPVLMDQEGGRVQRMKPPQWRDIPAPALFGDLFAKDTEAAFKAVHLNACLIGHELLDVGVDVNCSPSLDLKLDGASQVIGNRAFSSDAHVVTELGRAAANGFLAAGVLPVIKHIPGHGRAMVDSHLSLPVVEQALDILKKTDFAPFCSLNDLPLGMTAHIVFTAIDAENPGTVSAKIIKEIIREYMAFDGFLFSDDLSMEALEGAIEDRAAKTLKAGADAALHCNGKLDEMKRIAANAPELSTKSQQRWTRARATLPTTNTVLDFDAGVKELTALLETTIT
ncbi:MAG: beta-N-acetylhexosaminidase [Alphaproteobacteria bacterium]|nr:beta-N-acetylhexosaminidase [Alphaproteobacteria bacterium]MBT4018232.1 beta-N-acetylhexosaminidase [Alphaproteobacteria bacterium]MBT4966337.1 beta-N-acetylhexosaminidase [Alphaproteobacteria bacterium]MBT5160775.1 beta-N-acetylhexosaminidase [Alphaproteobacteria bacterium]MBT5918807.1 beta-N-acetylhexosaminidase [Alphaproteobacteria bacterium]